METYLVLLRGINVGGNKKVPMAELRKVLGQAGFQQVRTYIQSGNIFVSHPSAPAGVLAEKIAVLLFATFGFEVKTLVISQENLRQSMAAIPAEMAASVPPNRFFMVFLEGKPDAERLEKLQQENFAPEQFEVKESIIYFASPEGFSKGKLQTNFFEQRLKVVGTARNLKTMQKLMEMLG